eukprot:353364-Chlamydomonas_euryale.AAC.1
MPWCPWPEDRAPATRRVTAAAARLAPRRVPPPLVHTSRASVPGALAAAWPPARVHERPEAPPNHLDQSTKTVWVDFPHGLLPQQLPAFKYSTSQEPLPCQLVPNA